MPESEVPGTQSNPILDIASFAASFVLSLSRTSVLYPRWVIFHSVLSRESEPRITNHGVVLTHSI